MAYTENHLLFYISPCNICIVLCTIDHRGALYIYMDTNGRFLIFFLQVVESINDMGLQESSTSGGRKDSTRKNNEHWMQYEVQQLVNGVSEYGVGKWKAMKEKYFLTSIRTPVHLKVRAWYIISDTLHYLAHTSSLCY